MSSLITIITVLFVHLRLFPSDFRGVLRGFRGFPRDFRALSVLGYSNPVTVPLDLIVFTMAPSHKRRRQPKQKQTRRPKQKQSRRQQKGGTIPYVVDFKKGFELIEDPKMWSIPSKAQYAKAKKMVKGYKQEYKGSGSKKSYDDWFVSKGYGARSACTIMWCSRRRRYQT